MIFLDKDKKVLDGVSRILAGEVERSLKKLTGLREGRCGSLQFLQWGSSHDLNRHLHFHQVSTDGVFVENEQGDVEFHEADPPRLEEVRAVEQRIARRVLKLYVHRGCIEKDEAERIMTWEHSGFCAPQKSHFDWIDLLLFRGPRLILDASVAIEAADRPGLERLLRYLHPTKPISS